MDEQRWLACDKPEPMLKYLLGHDPTRRKLLLYACRCVRRIRAALVYEESERALDFVEDGLDVADRFYGTTASKDAHDEVRRDALLAVGCAEQDDGPLAAAGARAAAALLDSPTPGRARRHAGDDVGLVRSDPTKVEVNRCLRVVRHVRESLPPEKRPAEQRAQARLARCIFGNPFRAPAIDPRWRSPTAVGVARTIHDERAFKDLPVLADALADAGCEDEAVLGHCRGGGPHGRGCWVVDLVLGKSAQ